MYMQYLLNQQALEIVNKIISDVKNFKNTDKYISSLSTEEKDAHLQLLSAINELTNLSLDK